MNHEADNLEEHKPDWPLLVALGVLGLVLFVYRLGVPGLMDPDEGRYAEIAREFFVTRDWLIPHLNLLPYLEKPPLVYWLTALSFTGLGFTEAAARLPAAVSAVAGLFLAYGLGRAFRGPGVGMLSALVLATAAGYVALGRILTLDMTFALFLNLGIGLGYLALSRDRAGLWPWAYGALALAVLTKGPVALVLAGLSWVIWAALHPHPSPPPSRGREEEGRPAIGYGVGFLKINGISLRKHAKPKASCFPPFFKGGQGGFYSHLQIPLNPPLKKGDFTTVAGLAGQVITKPCREPDTGRLRLRLMFTGDTWRPLIQPRSWVVFLLITLPWFVYVQWRYPEFFRFFILEQHFGRFLTPAIHPEPLWYFLPVLLGLLLPWTWLLPWALGSRRRWRDPDTQFLAIWAGVIVVFFSLSRGKLVPYVLPALLPLALLVGQSLLEIAALGRLSFNRRALKVSLVVWAVTGVVLVALSLWPPAPMARALVKANLESPYVVTVALVWALTPLAALAWRHLGALVLGALLLAALIPLGIGQVSRGRSFQAMGLALKSQWQPGAALVGMQLYAQGLSFYSGHVFHLLGCRTELDFGQSLRPDKGLCLPDKAALGDFTRARPVTFFFLKADDLSWLKEGLPGKFARVAAHKDCILVAYEAK